MTCPKSNLETIIYEPLKSCQSANHCDSHCEAVPKAHEANVTVDAGYGLRCCLPAYFKTVSFLSHLRSYFVMFDQAT